MPKRHLDRDIVMLLVFTLITLVSWVGFEVYRAFTKVQIPEVSAKYLVPLNPNLNTSVLTVLESKQL
jgi:predicted negative regulator of RcsB-dependent stress response